MPHRARRAIGVGLVGLLALGLAPVGLLLVGYRVRGREKRILRLFRVLDRQYELRVEEFLANTDFTRESLEEAFRELNDAGVGYYVWDRKADVIQDARIRGGDVHFDVCPACRANISVQARVGSHRVPECPYCDARLDDGALSERKQALIRDLRQSRSRGAACAGGPSTPALASHPSEFSFGLFCVLMVFFWPLGIAYAARHAHKQGMLGRFEGL